MQSDKRRESIKETRASDNIRAYNKEKRSAHKTTEENIRSY